MSLRFLSVALVLSLTACGGGGSTSLPASAPGATEAVSEAQSDALRQPASQAPAPSRNLLYVSNLGANSITIYDHGAQGNTAPLKVIAGPRTQLSGPTDLSEDAQGNLYVLNESPLGVLVFAHGANGNVSPIRILSGPLTTIAAPEAMTVDKITGKLFVMDASLPAPDYQGLSSLIRFPPNANGNEAPFARSAAGDLLPAAQIASDSSGNNLIESTQFICCTNRANGTATIPKQFPNGGNPGYVYEITWFRNFGIADDPTTKTYLVTTESGIYRFAENANGQAAVFGQPSTITPPAVSVITSDICGRKLVLGDLRHIYVVHSAQVSNCTTGIYVYSHDSIGDAPPLRVLAGPATGLNNPNGIYEGP